MTSFSGPAPSTRMLAKGSRRDKPQLSCNFCRRRKWCDRGQPCDSCVRLQQGHTCSYPFPQLSQAQRTNSQTQVQSLTAMRSKIQELESLVGSLKRQLSDATTPAPPRLVLTDHVSFASDRVRLTEDFGKLHLDLSQSSYVESDHWTAILDGIAELKEFFRASEASEAFATDTEVKECSGPDLFFAETTATSKLEILAAIPPRPVIDNILAKYSTYMDVPFGLILHRHVFFKQYERFWENQHETPIMWIALLFGIIHFVLFCHTYAEGTTSDERTSTEYRQLLATSRERMVDCLKLGDWTKGTPHTVEALIFYLQTEYVGSEDRQASFWLMVGTIIRVALKMGYHRDGSHFPKMPAYDAEMRRRTWCILTQLDTAASSQAGLPRMIKQAECDTAEPRNLLDEDFDDTMCELPPARNHAEHTLTQFLIYKTKLVAVLGSICDFTTSSRQTHYVEAMRLDRLLTATWNAKPAVLNPKPIEKSIMESRSLIVHRLYLAITYGKAQITLHRKFMIPAKTDARYAYSHTTAIEAALQLLMHQREMHEQMQPGRLLQGERFKLISTTQAEFLLASTILCFDLHDDITRNPQSNSSLVAGSRTMRSKIVAALRVSYDVWVQQRDFSKRVQEAVQAIAFVLGKAQQAGLLEESEGTLGGSVQRESGSTPATEGMNSPVSTAYSDISGTDHIASSQSFGRHVHSLDSGGEGSAPSLQAIAADEPFADLFDFDEYWKSCYKEGMIDKFLGAQNLDTSMDFDFVAAS